MVNLKFHLFSAALLLTTVTVYADTAPDYTLPVSSLVANADALLAAGDKNAALDHFDAALKKDPANYLTLFKRGATYLSLGRSSQASADFDAVLSLKPDFEAALLQRARLKAKGGDWEAAKRDYNSAGKERHALAIEDISAADAAAAAARDAEASGEWEKCVENAGIAILVGQAVPSLRTLRARCRIQKGDVPEAVGDLAYAPPSLTPCNSD